MGKSWLRALFLGAVTASLPGQPVVKSGDCPQFSRYNAPGGEDWSQFRAIPNPASEFPVNTIQEPLSPAQSINCIEVPQGLRIETWASEQSPGGIAYPQHFAFDERGRMWLAEPRSYPNIIRSAEGHIEDPKFVGGKDRILILEDTDGDGAMDRSTVFRDGLNLPQSILVVNGGVVVAMVPYLVFFPDNGGTAGTPVILWDGMGSSGNYDTHGGIGSLMYGLDNWIYGHTGYNGCEAGGVDCGGGRVWRFQHKALGHAQTRFEAWTTGPANAWGIGQTEDGQIFQSGATRSPHINHSIRQGEKSIDIRFDPGGNSDQFFPITGDRFLWEGSTGKNSQGWFTSQTTAVSGLQFYTSRLLPKGYWGRFAFSCEGASKLCNQDSLVVDGSTWRAVRLPGPERSNIIASRDAWVAPLLATTGPDGAVWVLDWHNYLFLHNPARPTGPGRAWENHLREKERYRIYRILPQDGSAEPVLDLSTATTQQLVGVLSNPNMLWRLHAQRLLIGKGYSEELGTLLQNILDSDRSVDAVGNSPAVVHALWTLSGLGRLDMPTDAARWNPILKRLLRHPAWGVRRNVLRAMPRNAASAQAISEECAVNDEHGHVRLQALVALSEIGDKPAGLTPMWTEFRDVDSYAGSAFAAAGIASSASRPCSPDLDPVVPIREAATVPQPRSDLRFVLMRGGFDILPHGRLPSGDLVVYDWNGRIAFSSRYMSEERRWSQPSARGLARPVYAYVFRADNGEIFQGRISLVQAFR